MCVCERERERENHFVVQKRINTSIFLVPVQENAEQRAESLRRVQQIRQSDSRIHL